MNAHWPYREDEFDDGEDGAGTMVRPYTITRGRTAPERDDLTLITVLTTAHDAPDAHGAAVRPGRLQPEHRLILERCRRPAAVAEVSAGLDLPVSVTKILLADLVAAGLLIARAPLSVARASGGADMSVLAAVRDGLRRL
ncbi:DUF742 domain-containing protein [Streptomyces sp. NPDC087866]|uniref:DUF742 domain-containing protein n=1 Tax=unclassified Streptomyces TaxID=2593676 RepID=UPI0011CD8158|nr:MULTISPECIES: DUF742 domain-containing protein [unclassified Streptomyces]MCX4446257.1 DUF742 domain-containing protein [Streptomyces sp. NBC_01789]TXS07152.1 DUF742 domain-containing protein [Streptomyces sp. col6]